MSNSRVNQQIGRIKFLFSCLLVVFLSGAALRLTHSHPDSKRVLAVVGYGVALLGVFWTRSLESRLRDAGLPRWTFWPYFLIVFTGCLAAHVLKLTNSLETIGLFLVLQLPAVVFSSNPKAAESKPQSTIEEAVPVPVASKRRRPARPITPLGAIEFTIYVLLIVGLSFVLHLLRGDVAGLGMTRALRYAIDAASVLLCVPWILCVRGRFRSLGLTRWYPSFCASVLVVCAVPCALKLVNFQNALVLFAVLQLLPAILRRAQIPVGLVDVEASEVVDPNA